MDPHYSAVERLEAAAAPTTAPRGARFSAWRACAVLVVGFALVAVAQSQAAPRPAAVAAVEAEVPAEGGADYYIDIRAAEASLSAYSYSYASADAASADDDAEAAVADDGVTDGADDDDDEDDDEDWFGCFPGASRVLRENGAWTPLAAVRRGDRVLTRARDGSLAFAAVELRAHADAAAEPVFVRIALAAGANLTLTRGHYVPTANRGIVEAAAVEVGDFLYARADGGLAASAVVGIDRERGRGLFSPLTRNGFVIVDGVLASEYSRGLVATKPAVASWIARAAFSALPAAVLAAADAAAAGGGVRGFSPGAFWAALRGRYTS